jgi:hypothetical protein
VTFDPVEAAWQAFLHEAAVGDEEVSTFDPTDDEAEAGKSANRSAMRRAGIRPRIGPFEHDLFGAKSRAAGKM